MTTGLLCAVLFLLSGWTAARADSRRNAPLAKEVSGKGWILFSALTEKGNWDLFIMRPDGSHRRNITNTPDFNEVGGRFSPDGKKILFRRVATSIKLHHDYWGRLGQFVVAGSDGSNPVIYGEPGEFPWASWSPDGKQVACLTPGGIEIRDLATRAVVRRLDRKGIYQQIFWSPDGRWFCGTANHYGENWTVIRVNAETAAANPVAKFQNCTPDWFPDSRRLIYSSRPANQENLDGGKMAKAVGQKPGYGWTQLWMADGDGNNRMLVYGEEGRHIYGGAVSPDARYAVFTRSLTDGDLETSIMALMRLSDAPTIGGESGALRKLYPHAHDGPVLALPNGWEPHWTYAQIGPQQ